MEILIYYNRHRSTFVARDDSTQDELGTFETGRAAKDWVTENHPLAPTHQALPGGVRELKWETHCKCCGAAFDKPYLK